MKGFSIKLVPYEKFRVHGLSDILSDLKKNTIIVVDAKLEPEQEAALIQETMASITDRFSGIEMGSFDISKEDELDFVARMRGKLAELILGKKRGLTVIGPAEMIKKIKKDPTDLMFYLS